MSTRCRNLNVATQRFQRAAAGTREGGLTAGANDTPLSQPQGADNMPNQQKS